MILLDPDMKGCHVWLINSSVNGYKPNVTYIRGNTVKEICDSLINRLAFYKEDNWGYKELIWADEVYLDITAMGHDYKDIFNNKYDLPVIEVVGKSRSVIPERGDINEYINKY